MKTKQQNIQNELDNYFSCARKQKCPPSMKTKLYDEIGLNKAQSSWWSPKLAVAGLSLVFMSSVVFKITSNHQIEQDSLAVAQADLQIAMHYINQVSLKSLSSINNKGIKPGIIKPLARTYASL